MRKPELIVQRRVESRSAPMMFPRRSIRTRSRLTSAVIAAAVIGSGALLIATASNSAAAGDGAPPAGSKYVALGDSYAAGYGIGTSTDEPVPGCAQSTQDYPHQIAAALKLELTDVSCSGAVTANIDQTPQQTSSGTAPLQDKALTSDTKLVTVTIGGNDLGFSDIAQYCLADLAGGPLTLHPQLQNCKAHYAPTNGTDSLAARVQNVVIPAVSRVLDDIHAKAPDADVYFVDYPAISTTKAASPDPATYPDSCFRSVVNPQSFPFTGVDTEYLEQVQQNLNTSLDDLVGGAGDAFVETYPQSLPHSACAATPDPWMNGITLDPTTGGPAAGSLHPNLKGATQMATDALEAIRTIAPPSTSASATATPEPSTSDTASVSGSAGPPSVAGSGGGGTLSDTGAAVRQPLSVGLLLLLLGSGLLVAVRRRRRGAHR